MEAGGVTNPAAVRGSDGHLYLFPRLVAEGNYSRLCIARVLLFNEAGDLTGVERFGIARAGRRLRTAIGWHRRL